jgi:hypothetical protein
MKSNKKISVLVVNLNNLKFTKDCINDLISQDCEFNLTIIDQNSSEEGTKEYFSTLPSNVEFIKNEANIPLNHLWNWFVEKSNTPYICLLNNDVRIAPNFLSSAIQVFEKEPGVGFVNHVSNNVEYQSWSLELNYKIIDTAYRQGWDPIFRKECYNSIPNELSFFYGDDYIYSKLYSSGMKGAYVLNSPIIHFERSTTVEKGGQRDASPDGNFFNQLDLEFRNMSFVEELSKWKPEFETISSNLKDIFVILYFSNIEESINYLRNLVDELVSRNKKFMICSHSSIPQDIIDKCECYFYDSNNFIFDSGQRYFYWMDLGNLVIHSPYLYYGGLSHKNYSLAAIKNVLNSVSTSYQLGYDVIHSIEYDCIPNFEELDENLKLLSKYNAVVYKSETSEMTGDTFSIKVDKLLDLRWNEKYWLNYIKEYNCFAEKFLLHLIKKWSNDNVLVKPLERQTKSKVSSINTIQTVIFEENNIVKLFVNNSSNRLIDNILIYHSNGKLKIELYPYNWRIIDLGPKENNSFIDIFTDDILNRKWDISTDEMYNKNVSVNKLEKK